MLSEMGEIFFSILVSYMGALEFIFVMKHLYHWTFQHQRLLMDNEDGLEKLQDKITNSIIEASAKEVCGFKAMKDGVLYKDGFRVELGNENLSRRELFSSSQNSADQKKSTDHHHRSSDRIEDHSSKERRESIRSVENFPSNEINREINEKPFTKEEATHLSSALPSSATNVESENLERTNITVKTQFGQTKIFDYSLRSEQPNTILGKSEDSTPNERISKEKSNLLSTQQSSSPDTTASISENNLEYKQSNPEGQDIPEQQYSEEYLRSLDGIKHRPLVRDDGTGRRRAFKTRRSSDSTSSRESRASREEELKMFTSLEEEEFQAMKRGDSDYTPIRYSSEPNLKIGKHNRRHNKSPVKDSRRNDNIEENPSSLEMLGEEDNNPWGDVKREHYKDTEFWKREKAFSFEEEDVGDNNNSSYDQENENSLERKRKTPIIPNTTQHIPKLSSFEDATESQNIAGALFVLKKQSSRESNQKGEKENDDREPIDEDVNVSKVNINNGSQPNAKIFSASFEKEKSQETDIFACKVPDLNLGHTGMRRSPKLYDMDLVQDEFPQNDDTVSNNNRNMRENTIKFLENEKNNSFSPAFIPDLKDEERKDLGRFQDIKTNKEDIQSLINNVKQESISQETGNELDSVQAVVNDELQRNSKDSISNIDADKKLQEKKINSSEFDNDKASNDSVSTELKSEPSENEGLDNIDGLPEGISDFYDFNASINPSRSQSMQRYSKSKSPSENSRPSIRASLSQESHVPLKKSPSSENHQMTEDLSNFYDFNASIDKLESSHIVAKEREAYRNSIDYFEDKFKHQTKQDNVGTTNKENKILFDSIKSFSAFAHDQPSSSVTSTSTHSTTSLTRGSWTPSTPEEDRSLAINEHDIDRLKSEYRRKTFEKSAYIGESMDFDNDFEELREQTRNFRRSRSQSRSIIEDVNQENRAASRRILQDEILKEITKTTINYQEFSGSMNKTLLDYERRGSDSALIVKPELLIQLQDDQQEEDYEDNGINELEAEEYHHFRRFSLNQEYQVEEYPEDDYIYFEQIEVKTLDDYQDSYRLSPISIDSMDETNKSGANDLDTGSEDERLTVVEVEDEIDEDIFEYERPDEEHDQSEGEIAEREMDHYGHVNLNEDDWREEGAVGGILSEKYQGEEEDEEIIEKMYDEAVQNIGERSIQKHYDIIVESMEDEKNDRWNSKGDAYNTNSLQSEDLLNEILRVENEKYNRSRKSKKLDSKHATGSFIEHESELANYKTMSSTTSTGLRTRHGISPTSYMNYENLDTYSNDIPYVPQKEYNWRKNFRLDDDGESNTIDIKKESRRLSFDVNESEMISKEKSHENYLDIRKMSIGGESITLYSRTPDRILDFDGICKNQSDTDLIRDQKLLENENIKILSNDDTEHISMNENIRKTNLIESKSGSNSQKEDEKEENVEKLKKKRNKKKQRKGSKTSLETNDDIVEDENFTENEKHLNKKSKKLKKSKTIEKKSTQILNDIDLLDTTTEVNQNNNESVNHRSTNMESLKNTKYPNNELSSTEAVLVSSSSDSKPSTIPSILEATTSDEKPESTGNSSSKVKPSLERRESTGAYELIKDGSMYPWF